MRNGSGTTSRRFGEIMAKIRLYKTKGGGRGWSVPYRMGSMTLRKFVPIAESSGKDGLRGKGTKDALGEALQQSETALNHAGKPGSAQ